RRDLRDAVLSTRTDASLPERRSLVGPTAYARPPRQTMTAPVFLVLLAGHLLGDWIAQTDWQATTKTRSWAALAAHVASYHLLMGLLRLIPILRGGVPRGNG